MIFFLLAGLAAYLLARSTRRWGAYALTPVASVFVVLGTIVLVGVFAGAENPEQSQKAAFHAGLSRACLAPFVISFFVWLNRITKTETLDEEAFAQSLKVHRKASYWSMALVTLVFLGWSGIGVPSAPEDYDDAVSITRKAEAGDAEAQLALGDSYGGREKYGLKRNLELAAQWYRKAAEKGNREAQHKLGICYSFGQGLAQNDAMAAGWYRKAAEAGLAEAQTSLGYCYAHGRGVPLDIEEAKLWLTRAGGQGDDNAVSLLKELSVKGAQK
jgi:hypothetical protein